MGNKNTNLHMAKSAKDDEFYTTYETIAKEVAHYKQHFENKTVLCNCDDPFESNFCKYFLRNFNLLKLKRLICTSYGSSKVVATQLMLWDDEDEPLQPANGYVLDVSRFCDGEEEISEEYVAEFLRNSRKIKKLKGDGDFRSLEMERKSKKCV